MSAPELTWQEIRFELAKLVQPYAPIDPQLRDIVTKVQQWQIEQRVAYQLEISRLERELERERREKSDLQLRFSEVRNRLDAMLAEYWASR
jgi:hypothetical protein